MTIAKPARQLVALSDAEILALIVAAHLTSDAPFAVSSTTAANKLLDTIDPGQRDTVNELRNRFRIARPTTSNARVRSVIEDAIRTQHVIRIKYRDRNGADTNRRVEPVGLYYADNTWSLIGWCELRDAARLFHLYRIRSPSATFARTALRDIDDVLGWVPQPGTQP